MISGKSKNDNQNTHAKRRGKQVFRISIFVLIGFILLLTTASVYVYFKRNDIAREFLNRVNEHHNGKIHFADISINPLVHFPNISIQLKDLEYTLQNFDSLPGMVDTLARVNHLYVSIDFLALLAGDISAKKMTIQDGKVHLFNNQYGQLNLVQALAVIDKSTIERDTASIEEETDTVQSGQKTRAGDLDLSAISMKNLTFCFYDTIQKTELNCHIHQLDASLIINPDSIVSHLNIDSKVNRLNYKNFKAENREIKLSLAYNFNRYSKNLKIKKGNLVFDKSHFSVFGDVGLAKPNDIDIVITGSDDNFTLLGAILSETGLRNIHKGSSYFNGTIKGNFDDQIPVIDLAFGLQDIQIKIPEIAGEVSHLNLKGLFNSGIARDFSEASLEIIKLTATLPEGNLDGSFHLQNFQSPHLKYKINLAADLNGFDKIFNLAGMENLSGRIEIHDQFDGHYHEGAGLLEELSSDSKITLDHISFVIPDLYNVRDLSGQVQRNSDTLLFNQLYIDMGHSDIAITGHMSTLYDLLFDKNKEIVAELQIVSDTFDLPNILVFEPRIKRNFPVRFTGVNASVKATTITENLKQFELVPEIDVQVLQLTATMENYFPPATIHKGDFKMLDRDSSAFFNFSGFEIEMAGADIFAHVEVSTRSKLPDQIKIETSLNKLNPGKVFQLTPGSSNAYLFGEVNGTTLVEIETGVDSLNMNVFDVFFPELTWRTEEDTLLLDQFTLTSKDIYFGHGESGNLFEDLSFNATVSAERIKIETIDLSNIDYEVKGNDGNISIDPHELKMFGKTGEGYFKFRPFAETPFYEVKYTVHDFRAEHLLSNLKMDTLLNGEMDLAIDVVYQDAAQEKPYVGLNGSITLEGTDLILHGLDVDAVIKRYNRSQKFNLVDLGAVAVAGPFGLAITKGSDFARLALGGVGEYSEVSRFIASWEINNGIIQLKDVAFASDENLIAAQGWISLPTDSLEVTFAVLDKNGCSVLSQRLFGEIKDPKTGELKIVSAVLGPVSNLIQGAVGKDCEVFYEGTIEHPIQNKKAKKNNQQK